MNPEILFDYLEGNLSAIDHAQIEEKLRTDTQLQRELAIAREMHVRKRGAREVLGVDPDPGARPLGSAVLAHRVAIAFAALVFLNVLVGIAFIAGKRPKMPRDTRAREEAIRQQLSVSLQQTAETAMPPPRLNVNEIEVVGSRKELASLADNVLLIAQQCGGAASKAPPDPETSIVLAEIPPGREKDFLQALEPLGAKIFSSPEEKPNERQNRNSIFRVRISARTASSP